jgi:peptidyl-prolyl cis-trans isomerase SurA
MESRSMTHRSRGLLLGLGLFIMGSLPLPAGALAQEAALVDRMAAIVGDSVIVLSQIEERMFQLEYQLRTTGGEMPPEGSEAWLQLQRDILDQMIGEQLIVQAAARDTLITVDDLEVEDLVSEEINQRVSEMGGQDAFESGLARQGFTLAGYREFLRGQVRQQRLYQQYMAKRSSELSSVIVEESEVRDFFESQREVMGQRPPIVSFAQIILAPSPSDSVWDAAAQKADSIYQLAMAGEDFGELARRFSDDPSRDSGGDLGWFRRGEMVEEFEDAAFNMAVDQISPPVRSQFGYHVIKVTRRRSGEVRASHILVMVRPSPADIQSTRDLAGEIRRRLLEGEDFEALREEYGETQEQDSLRVPFDRLRELPPGYAEPLSQSEGGQVLEPIRYEVRGETRFAVVKVIEVLPAGPYTLDDPDLRARIVETLQQQKLVERILDELRSATYVEILI